VIYHAASHHFHCISAYHSIQEEYPGGKRLPKRKRKILRVNYTKVGFSFYARYMRNIMYPNKLPTYANMVVELETPKKKIKTETKKNIQQ
jgi:hypothetical protein